MLTHQLMLGSRQFSRIFDVGDGDLLTENSENLVQEDGDKLLLDVFVGTYWELGDHSVGQSIYATFDLSSGSTNANAVTNLGYLYNTYTYLFTNTGDLVTVHKLSGQDEYGFLVWDLNAPWDLSSGYSGPTVEMILDGTYWSTRSMHAMEWDSNGDLVVLFIQSSNLDYLYLGYDLNNPYTLSNEGTKSLPNKSQSFSMQNEGQGFSIDDTAFYQITYNLGSMLKYGVSSSNQFMLNVVLQTLTPVPDRGNLTSNVKGSVHVFDSGNGMIISSDNGNVGSNYYGIRRYSMSTPYDMTTLTMEEHIDFSSSGTNYRHTYGDPEQFRWKTNGDKYYWGGSNGYGGYMISQVNV